MNKPKNLLIICNPVANKGKSLEVLNQLGEFLTHQGFHHFFVYTTEKPMDMRGISDALHTPHDAVVLIGGDGTLYDFVNSTLNPEKENIIYIPAGSGNDFARSFYGRILPAESYFSLLFANHWARVDCGICNGKKFVNGFGAGFDGYVATHAQRGIAGKLKGESKYQFAVLQGIAFFSPSDLIVKVDGELRFQDSCFMVSIGNGNQFGGGYILAPGAQLDDGLLNVVLIPQINSLLRILHLPKVKSGVHIRLPFVKQFQGSEIELEFPSPIAAHIDGEIFEAEYFRLSLSSKPLRFAQFT